MNLLIQQGARIREVVLLGLLGLSLTTAFGQTSASVRSMLLTQLSNTHTYQDWFVHLNKATADLTPEQATWYDSTTNHSIAQLITHLSFYNERVLRAFQGGKVADFTGENEETFSWLSGNRWPQAVNRLDSLQTKWYRAVEKATDQQLAIRADTVANLCLYNAYYTGQIIYIRKKNGWWNAEKTKNPLQLNTLT